ncbi:MAG: aminoacyl-tRNA hydrolase [Lachnospiraceae bacterium]|nr:aminoacyl-tRNA hydrolase [Lachnospiraceae bacterium]
MSIFDLFRQIESGSAPAASGPVTHLVVGLGNPGAEYANSRHNAGFRAIDLVADANHVRIDRAKFHALVGDGTVAGKHVLLMKPQTYMNSSGIAVKEAMDFYKIPSENVIVLFDDISLVPGKMRIRRSGSAGGHNGVKSLIEYMGTNVFPRVKLGVGAKPEGWDLADWVLAALPPEDRKALDAVSASAPEAVALLLEGKTDEAMRKFN